VTQPVEDPSGSQSLIGQNLGGRYTVTKLLGEGGMGAVYLGEQKLGQSLRKVAIKTLHPHLSHDPKILARFERECETVAELQHPNTIQVFDFGKTDSGILYIVMEYAEGHSVAEDLEKSGPMDPPRVQKILEQVCGSLEEAHNHGIVHRDLKPDNVLLCERAGKKDWVEVLDFGIAKRGNEHDANEAKLTQQGTVLGTPPYMSPEQFTGKPVDARSDIYSLGVMAYEMLSGRLPFNGNTAWEWASAHMTAQPSPIESTGPLGAKVPVPMKNAISKALEKAPENRFQSVKDFYEAFSNGAVSVSSSMTGSRPSAEPPRANKTEIGAPIPVGDFGIGGGGGFGAAPPVAPAMGPAGFGAAAPTPAPGYGGGGGYGPPPQAGTPASGNQAFAAPQVHAREEESGGGNRGLILGLLALVSIGVVGAILVATGVFKSKPSTDPGPITATTTVATTPTSTPVPGDTGGGTTTADTSSTPAPLPTLAETGTHPTTPGGKKPPATGSATAAPTHSGTTPTAPATTPTAPATTPTVAPTHPTPPPQVDTAACAEAVRWCNHPAFGKDPSVTKRCNDNKPKCLASGGHV
jgi:eukaryotic-like serine/threonine-protein kinase